MAQNFIEGFERRFTRFEETSELSALNRSAGDWFSVSPEMMELLITTLDCHMATDGLFDPSILADLHVAGYTHSFDQLPRRLPIPEAVSSQRDAAPSFGRVQLDPVHYRVQLPAGMQIDLGGIAKGWIVEKAAKLMARSSTTCAVNAGGDMFLIGQPQGQTAWEIGLEDPNNSKEDLMILLVDEGAVATSSVVKRSWFQGDVKCHHIIDPRNGKPAETPWLSVTVFAPRAVTAETFAKAFLLAGPERIQSLLDNNPLFLSSPWTRKSKSGNHRPKRRKFMNTHDGLKNTYTQSIKWTNILSIIALPLLVTLVMVVGLPFIQIENRTSTMQIINDFLALENIHIWWYISRAAGLVGYLLIWFSTIWGFAVSSKIFDSVLERVFTFDFHEHLSLLGLGFMGLHAIVLFLDRVEPLNLTEILIPFISSYRPFWTGIGIIAFYLSVLVTVTFYIRSRISTKAFRTIHYLSITAYAGSLFHGLYAGTDSSLPWVQWMYWGTFLSTIFFLVYWLGNLWLRRRTTVHRDQIKRGYHP